MQPIIYTKRNKLSNLIILILFILVIITLLYDYVTNNDTRSVMPIVLIIITMIAILGNLFIYIWIYTGKITLTLEEDNLIFNNRLLPNKVIPYSEVTKVEFVEGTFSYILIKYGNKKQYTISNVYNTDLNEMTTKINKLIKK